MDKEVYKVIDAASKELDAYRKGEIEMKCTTVCTKCGTRVIRFAKITDKFKCSECLPSDCIVI